MIRRALALVVVAFVSYGIGRSSRGDRHAASPADPTLEPSPGVGSAVDPAAVVARCGICDAILRRGIPHGEHWPRPIPIVTDIGPDVVALDWRTEAPPGSVTPDRRA